MIEQLKRLHALADTGLIYSDSEYDRERYEEIKAIVNDMTRQAVRGDWNVLDKLFAVPIDYPTAKVDVRAFVLSEDGSRLLMAREKADGRWSLPGGWADVGYSASENAVKECREETGIITEAVRLLALWDKSKHPHPPEGWYVYKVVVHCRITGGALAKGFDVLDAQFFPVDDLPELSEDRILKSQIDSLLEIVRSGAANVLLD